VDLPLVEPLGQDNAMYEGSEYLDWAQRHETLLQVFDHGLIYVIDAPINTGLRRL
jgi:hypothetical protein